MTSSLFYRIDLLTDEDQERNLAIKDGGYQAVELMPQSPAVAVKRNGRGWTRWQSYPGPFKGPPKLTYQQLRSVQSLPQVL